MAKSSTTRCANRLPKKDACPTISLRTLQAQWDRPPGLSPSLRSLLGKSAGARGALPPPRAHRLSRLYFPPARSRLAGFRLEGGRRSAPGDIRRQVSVRQFVITHVLCLQIRLEFLSAQSRPFLNVDMV